MIIFLVEKFISGFPCKIFKCRFACRRLNYIFLISLYHSNPFKDYINSNSHDREFVLVNKGIIFSFISQKIYVEWDYNCCFFPELWPPGLFVDWKYILNCHISTYCSLLSGKDILVCDITSESILLRGKDILGCHISTDRQLNILASL